MDNNVLRPLGAVLKKFKKIWIILIILVILVINFGIFVLKDFSLGYRYYEFNNETNTQVTVGYSKKEINIFSVIWDYRDSLEKEGYLVISCVPNKEILNRKGVVPRSEIDTEKLKQNIIKDLDVSIISKKIVIKEDVYYFKDDEDKSKFVKELNSIKKVEYNEKEEIVNLSQITKQEVLDKKIETYKKENTVTKKVATNKRASTKTTSRSESSRTPKKNTTTKTSTKNTKSNYKSGAPMASYVYISSPYGYRWGRMHTGIDFAAHKGTHVYAWKSGTVTQASYNGSYGNFISIKHDDGTVSRYAHLSGYNCKKGDKVEKGQTIGYVGSTGHSTGAHLHFEIKVNGKFVNPANYI